MKTYNQREHGIRAKLMVALITINALMCWPVLLQAKEVTQQYNGLTLNANLEMAEGKTFKDGIVLLLHGFLAHNKMEIIETAQQALLDVGHSSLAINLSLGIDNRHGFHGCDRPHRHIQDNAIKELAAWVAWLRRKGVEDITLIGHSSGANQVSRYAVEQLDPEVSRIVLLAPGTAGREHNRENYQIRYDTNFENLVSSLEKKVIQGKGDILMKIDWNACSQADTTPRSFLSYHSPNNKFANIKANLIRIKIPVMVIAGDLDELQPNTPEILESIIDNEKIRLTVIEGAGHFFRDFNIEEAIEATIEFILES